jgi:hypothetical protein
MLWDCGAIAEGCRVLLGARRVAVVSALRLAADDLRRRCPELAVACPYMHECYLPTAMTGSHVTRCNVVGMEGGSSGTAFLCGGATPESVTLGGAADLAYGGDDGLSCEIIRLLFDGDGSEVCVSREAMTGVFAGGGWVGTCGCGGGGWHVECWAKMSVS